MACTSPLMVLHPLWSPGLSHFEDRNRITFFFPIAGFFFLVGWGRGGRRVGLHTTDYFRLKTQVKLSYYGRAGTLYCFNANNAPVPQFNCYK